MVWVVASKVGRGGPHPILGQPLGGWDGLLAAPWQQPFKPGLWLPASFSLVPPTRPHCVQVANAFSWTFLRGLERDWDSEEGRKGEWEGASALHPSSPLLHAHSLCLLWVWGYVTVSGESQAAKHRSTVAYTIALQTATNNFHYPSQIKSFAWPSCLFIATQTGPEPHALPIPLWQHWATVCIGLWGQTKLFLSFIWAGSAAWLSRKEQERHSHLCSEALLSCGSACYYHLCEARAARLLRLSLEGVQQDKSGSLPKYSLAPNAVSVLDISLFNFFWPDIFLNQECVNSLRNVCMRGQLHAHY
jgi:hypothetical protein